MPTTVWARHKKRYTCTAFSPFEQAQDMARFDNKVVLVSGGARGQGAAEARLTLYIEGIVDDCMG
jgi:hypothetical protein